MKIVKLIAENYKKLRAVEITPTGEMVVISGRNNQGKTSVLDAIWAALRNADHIQAMPIRTGSDKARINLDLGELVVERRFTTKGSTLTVEKADGARYTSPQGILDALLGALTFDPLAFVNQDPEDQFEALRKMVPLDVDLDELESLDRKDFEERTEINRRAKHLRAQAEGIVVPEKLPAGPIDTKALKDQMANAAKVNMGIHSEKARRLTEESAIQMLWSEAEACQKKCDALREEAEELGRRAFALWGQAEDRDVAFNELPSLEQVIDVDGIRDELDRAEELTRFVVENQRRSNLLKDAENLDRQSHELTSLMETRGIVKDEAIRRAPMPVAGLAFGDGVVTFEGVPFSQASTAVQLKVSVSIAMAANPKLRVIRIKEGSLLDTDSLKVIADMAREHDYQVWIERVDMSGKVGIVIEDGMVVAVDGEAV